VLGCAIESMSLSPCVVLPALNVVLAKDGHLSQRVALDKVDLLQQLRLVVLQLADHLAAEALSHSGRSSRTCVT
jgi:hypothetical protein